MHQPLGAALPARPARPAPGHHSPRCAGGDALSHTTTVAPSLSAHLPEQKIDIAQARCRENFLVLTFHFQITNGRTKPWALRDLPP